MHHPSLLADSPSAIDGSSLPRAATPGPEERLSHTIKSLFTLADVAARRRACRNFRKLTVNTDENRFVTAVDAASSSPLVNLRRSKSSGDVAVLGEKSRALNVNPDVNKSKKGPMKKVGKCNHGRSATTSSTTPSKKPKVKPPTSLNIDSSCPPSMDENDWSPQSPPAMAFDISKPEGLNVIDDALFVMLTPHTPVKPTKNLILAAHVPSLPKVASPFSPRISPSWVREQSRPCGRSSPGTGHTSASLHLTKSHWELRYEAWIRSLRTYRRPRSAQSNTSSVVEEPLPRSRFPDPPTNPALFPRAGMLTPKALRHYSLGSDEDSRSTLELDWALRAWPMDKIQRTLFVHDMDVRVWFPVTPSLAGREIIEDPAEIDHPDLDLGETSRLNNNEREKDRVLRRWEWDWELRWRVVEGMVEDEIDKDRTEAEYDVFLVEENHDGDRAYGGCEVEAEERIQAKSDDWEWNEDAMEIDSVL